DEQYRPDDEGVRGVLPAPSYPAYGSEAATQENAYEREHRPRGQDDERRHPCATALTQREVRRIDERGEGGSTQTPVTEPADFPLGFIIWPAAEVLTLILHPILEGEVKAPGTFPSGRWNAPVADCVADPVQLGAVLAEIVIGN